MEHSRQRAACERSPDHGPQGNEGSGMAAWEGTGGKVGRSQTTCDPVHPGRDLDCVLRAAGGRVGFSTGSKVTGLHIRKFIGCSGGN